MEPIRVFVSYSSKDKKMAGEIDAVLKVLRMEPFLAHGDSIETGKQWKEAVREAIRECDILVALVTPNFRESEYTEQEVGAAWGLKKPVLTILTDGEKPSGFIVDWQGVKYTGYPPAAAGEIMRFALSEHHGRENVVDMLVERLAESESFKESEYLAFFLEGERCKHEFTAGQYKSIEATLRLNARVFKSKQAVDHLYMVFNIGKVIKGS